MPYLSSCYLLPQPDSTSMYTIPYMELELGFLLAAPRQYWELVPPNGLRLFCLSETSLANFNLLAENFLGTAMEGASSWCCWG